MIIIFLIWSAIKPVKLLVFCVRNAVSSFVVSKQLLGRKLWDWSCSLTAVALFITLGEGLLSQVAGTAKHETEEKTRRSSSTPKYKAALLACPVFKLPIFVPVLLCENRANWLHSCSFQSLCILMTVQKSAEKITRSRLFTVQKCITASVKHNRGGHFQQPSRSYTPSSSERERLKQNTVSGGA